MLLHLMLYVNNVDVFSLFGQKSRHCSLRFSRTLIFGGVQNMFDLRQRAALKILMNEVKLNLQLNKQLQYYVLKISSKFNRALVS